MQMTSAIFYGLSALLIGLSLFVVLAKDVFRSAIALAGALVVVGGLFAWFNADFLAASQLLVYVGGVLVLMLFVIMLLMSPQSSVRLQTSVQAIPAALLATMVAVILCVHAKLFWTDVLPVPLGQPTTAPLGRWLLTDAMVPFEVISLVLLAAVIGAVYLCRDEKR